MVSLYTWYLVWCNGQISFSIIVTKNTILLILTCTRNAYDYITNGYQHQSSAVNCIAMLATIYKGFKPKSRSDNKIPHVQTCCQGYNIGFHDIAGKVFCGFDIHIEE